MEPLFKVAASRRVAWPVLILLAACVTAGAEDWPTAGGAGDRAGATAEELVGTLSAGWAVALNGGVRAEAIVAEGLVIVGDEAGTVWALSEATGSEVWRNETGYRIDGPVGYDLGVVVVASLNGFLYGLDVTDGTEIWKVSGGIMLGGVQVTGGRVYLSEGFPSTFVVCRDVRSGDLVWRSDVLQLSYDTPAVGGGLVAVGTNDGLWWALSAADGGETWRVVTPGQPWKASASVGGGDVFGSAGTLAKNVYRWAGADGSEVWSASFDNPSGAAWTTPIVVSDTALGQGNVYFTAGQGNLALFARAQSDGGEVWAVDLGVQDGEEAGVGGVCVTADGTVLAVGHAGELYLVAAADGTVLQTADLGSIWGPEVAQVAQVALLEEEAELGGGAAARPVLANGRIYVGTLDGRVVTLSTGNTAPAAPGEFSLAGGADTEVNDPTLAWSAVTDGEDDGVTYILQLDTDGEFLEDVEQELTQVETEAVLGPYADGTQVWYRARTADEHGARGAWTEPDSFWVRRDPTVPEDPTDVAATAEPGRILLTWGPSPSDETTEYRLNWHAVGAPWGSAVTVSGGAAAREYLFSSVTNGTTYEIRVWAADAEGDESPGVTVTALPQEPAEFGGFAYQSVQPAINAAANAGGGVVSLRAVRIDLAAPLRLPGRVTLRGAGVGQTTLQGHGVVVEGGSGKPGLGKPEEPARLEDVVLVGIAGEPAVLVEAGGWLQMENCIVVQGSSSVAAVWGQAGSDLEVKNVTVCDNTGDGIRAEGDSGAVRNSIVAGNGGASLAGSAIVSRYNDVTGNGSNYALGAEAGTGDISVAVSFLNTTPPVSGEFYLEAPGSLTIDAGDPADSYANESEPNGGRINMGAYGNRPGAQTGSTVSGGSVVTSGGASGSTAGGGGGGGCFLRSAGKSRQVER